MERDTMTQSKILKPALFITRILIFLFLLPWQTLRFTNHDGAAGIANRYYKISTLPPAIGLAIGVFMMVLLLAFVTGFKKTYSYGLVFLLHAAGTIMTIGILLPPYPSPQRLFLAAMPTAGAMLLLWVLRKEDTLLSFGGKFG